MSVQFYKVCAVNSVGLCILNNTILQVAMKQLNSFFTFKEINNRKQRIYCLIYYLK